ncbi:glucans biosynthesis glucosyltransferase MdoH [Xanthobacter sp. KR7-225]|uniref:glucans biosynthesis glucosyltransferase MdoH n=1 Tax=Xanthobacter sp. KR7-225 TaxID=3156613 RepID=UPI0032B3AB4A
MCAATLPRAVRIPGAREYPMSFRPDLQSPTSFPQAPPAPSAGAADLSWRRRFMLAANGATLAVVVAATFFVLAQDGFTVIDALVLLCALAITPWHALGFWNSAVGLALRHGGGDGTLAAAPFLAAPAPAHAGSRVAILMTLRNEDPARAVARLAAVKAELDAGPLAAIFDYHLLSDTSRPEVAAAEEALVAAWRAQAGGARVFYRRRAENVGFKAGNIRDFLDADGARYDFMLPLDADSLMGAGTILAMVGIMQAHPRMGILQSLAVGLPAQSGFARLFQFGMRAGMRCYTLGATWWAGDCGPYWGHNALIRVAPFRAFCHLPDLPGAPPFGGPILSHDQVEAVLMRRAGFEVRVLPVECESFEENPPAATDFITRDLRWCLGNLQYVKLLALPGLAPMSRFQLLWAILMFATVPALPLALVLAPFAAAEARAGEDFPAGIAAAIYGALLLMSIAPKLAGWIDVALTPGGAARYGGAGRFAASAVLELVFSFMLVALTAFAVTGLLARLAFGRVAARWSAQARDGHAVPLALAVRRFWMPTLFGLLVAGAAWALAPGLLVWLVPLLAGYVLAIPFAVATADPRFGAWLAARGLAATPEEFDPPPVLRRLRGEMPCALEAAA